MDAAEAAATKANVEEEAARLAADNADGLGEERRSAVLAEAEAAAAQGALLGSSSHNTAGLSLLGHALNVVSTNSEKFLLSEHCMGVTCAGGKTLKSKLARSGHTATLLGTRVLITGGILRDGSLYVDIVIVDLSTLKVSRCAELLF